MFSAHMEAFGLMWAPHERRDAVRVITFGFSLGPILFGIGFLAPLIAALLSASNIGAPLGFTPIQFGLGLGVILGLVARQRRTWLW